MGQQADDQPQGDRVEFAQERWRAELRLREQELDLRRKDFEQQSAAADKSFWRRPDPLTLAIVGAIFTLLGTVAASYFEGRNALDVERQRSRADLILEAIKTGDVDEARANLSFLVEAGLVEDPTGRIATAVNKNQPVLPVESAPRTSACANPGAPAPATAFDDIATEYQSFFEAAEVRPERAAEIDFQVSRLQRSRSRYEAAVAGTPVPWYVVGVTGFDFSRHLHNGDPLTDRTVHPPSGRPEHGDPPFTWEESARDALALHGLIDVEDWSLSRVLYTLKRLNGFGYRRRGVPTPYLWGFTTLYECGRFLPDGRFDSTATSRQPGAAALLKVLQAKGVIAR